MRSASEFGLDTLGGRTRQDAAVPSGRAFQHNTAGVKRDFQQHATQRM